MTGRVTAGAFCVASGNADVSKNHELGLIIPPIGLVILIINAMAPQIALSSLYRAVMPFILADMLVLSLIVLFPAIALWLPALMRG